jgi:hypothetical protein
MRTAGLSSNRAPMSAAVAESGEKFGSFSTIFF